MEKMTSVMISVTLEEAERIAKWESYFIPMASVPHFSRATHPTRVFVYATKKGNESNPRAGKVLCDFYMYEYRERAGRKPRFDWVIMDVLPCMPPRELSKFGKVGFGKFVPLKRPPISWMYVEEKENGND